MNYRFSSRTPALIVVGALSAVAFVGCGDDGNPKTAVTPPTSDAGPSTSSTEEPAGSESGKPANSGTAKPVASTPIKPGQAADGGDVPVGPLADGGVNPAPSGTGMLPAGGSGDIDDIIGVMCDWEFNCCDSGERAYRFGPGIADAAACKTRFVKELHESNSTKNPFKSGSAAGGLMAQLAYQVDLGKVTINKDNVNKCVTELKARKCNMPVDSSAAPVACVAGGASAKDPCALTELFAPKLKAGETCTLTLASAGPNDVECVKGTTCVADGAGTGANVCVSRGLLSDACKDDTDCDQGLACDKDLLMCGEKAKLGEKCKPDAAHPQGTCQDALSCDPTKDGGTCVASCTEGYSCAGVDAICPAGLSCIPVIASNDDLFKLCKPVGTNTQAKCDTAADCKDGFYCKASSTQGAPGNCVAVKSADDPCTLNDECPGGFYCSTTCKPWKTTEECTQTVGTHSLECGPGKECLGRSETVNTVETFAYKCRSAKSDDGTECKNAYDCKSGKCEVTKANDTKLYCTQGAAIGENCDALAADAEKLSCKAGGRCDSKTNRCVALLPAGADCTSSTDKTLGDATLCGNATCTDYWKDDAFICTDVATPVASGGSGVQCDGAK